MALPPRTHYTLHEVTARWGCNIADVAGWADAGRFRIMTGIAVVHCGSETVAGKVVLSPMELLPLFRRCGTGPTEGVMRRIQPIDREDWLLITDPICGVPVAIADMLVLAEEVHGFEEENDMVRRVTSPRSRHADRSVSGPRHPHRAGRSAGHRPRVHRHIAGAGICAAKAVRTLAAGLTGSLARWARHW